MPPLEHIGNDNSIKASPKTTNTLEMALELRHTLTSLLILKFTLVKNILV